MSSFFAKLHRPGSTPITKQELTVKKIRVTAAPSTTGRSQTPSSRHNTPARGSTPSSDKSLKRKHTSHPSEPQKQSIPKKKKSAPVVVSGARPFAETDDTDDEDASSGGRAEGRAMDPKRKLLDLRALRCEERVEFRHAESISRPSPESNGAYRRGFPLTKSPRQEVELIYPAMDVPEKYLITVPRNPDDFAPVDEMVRTMELIAETFLPSREAEEVLDEGNGCLGSVKRAWRKRDKGIKNFFESIDKFNNTMAKLKSEGNIELHMRESPRRLSFELIEHILSQTYARTVAPEVDTLRAYEAFSNNVYGELLPKFTGRLFKDAGLRSDQVFVDLGSGIGNVVLHAALEVGCESWGCEMMEAAYRLADKQKKEFLARCKLYGIRPGNVTLEKGDFCDNSNIAEALKRADLLLVNNYAFSSELNGRLLDMFLDLKEGCTIVSLKSFVPPNHVITERNVGSPINLLTVEKMEYFSGSVSWTSAPGTYYVHKLDRTALQQFLKSRGESGI